jgi:hypothetical protein
MSVPKYSSSKPRARGRVKIISTIPAEYSADQTRATQQAI